MPKPRVIDSGFFDDLDIAQLTRDERLLMIAIVSRCADDYGRLIAHPAYLRKQAFGYDEDISIDDVTLMRAHILENCRNVLLYEIDGQEYICLTNWAKYQKIRYHVPSKLPAPPQESPEPVPQIDGKLPVISRESDAKVTEDSPRAEQGSVEQGSVEVEQGSIEQGCVVAAGSSLQNLLDIGLDPDEAQRLASDCAEDAVRGWCDELKKRNAQGKKIENPPGWVRSMLVRGIPPPKLHDNGLAAESEPG